MKWFQKNNYIVLLLGVSAFIFIIFTMNAPKNISYEEIEIKYGDSLWSLAEKYHGNMSVEKWIDIVKVENDLENISIIAGETLIVPIEKGQGYFTTNEIEIAREE